MGKYGFTAIDNEIFRDRNLTMQEKYLLIVLKIFDYKGTGEVYPTYETIMDLAGINRRNNLSSVIKSLCDKKYICIGKRGNSNCYCFIKDYLLGDKKRNSKSVEIKDSKDKVIDNTNGDIKKTGNKAIDSIDGDTKNKNYESDTNINGDTKKSINGDTGIIKDKNNKEIYIRIFDEWNKNNISRESELTTKISNSITSALKNHKVEDIISAINHYAKVYYSKFYYDHVWKLQEFLIKPNGMKKFLDDGQVWQSYMKKPKEKVKLNLSELID